MSAVAIAARRTELLLALANFTAALEAEEGSLVGRYRAARLACEVARTVLQAHLASPILKAGSRRALEELLRRHPRGLTRAQLAQAVGQSLTSSSFDTYVSRLRSSGLIEKRREEYFAVDALFLGGR